MNKLKTGKGALKDYNRYLADEYDDYAEEPEESDPIAHIAHSNTYQQQVIPKKPKTHKLTIKQTSRWPKYQPEFNFVVASRGIFEGLVGEKLAIYLNISDVAKLLRTCQYLNRIFSKTSIWSYYLTKSYRNLGISKSTLSSINIIQYSKYLRGARNYDVFFEPNGELGMRNDGITFDTVVMERHMKNEEKQLARNVVDSVTVKSQKTIDTTNRLAVKGTLTGDIKISWMKEMNQVCVWMAGHHARNKNLQTFAGILFNKKYNEEIHLIKKAYFLNDQYFVVEIEEKNEDDGLIMKSFEMFVIEPEPNWFEKKEAALCKQILKQTFPEGLKNIKVKNIKDFVVFILEKDKSMIGVQIHDMNGESVYKSGDFCLDAGLSDVISSKFVVHQNSLSLYLLDQESNIYVLSYSLDAGVVIKKINQPEKVKEEEEKLQLFHDTLENQRFSETIKRYHYGTYKKVIEEGQSQTIEYLFLYKEKKFYSTKFDTNELVQWDLPEYDNIESRLYNWTLCGNYLYLLLDTTIQIYQLDFISCSATLYKKETIMKSKFNGDEARWILVNPCMTIIVSASSLLEGFVRSLELLIGSTQTLLMKVDPFEKKKFKRFENVWHFDECRVDNIVGHVDKWQINEKETVEFKFEDERLLIQTDVRSYFRDFNVYERRVSQEQYGWRVKAIYNLTEPTSTLTESSFDLQENTTKKNDTSFVNKLLAFENNTKMKRTQNWKNVEKKADTEEKLEKKESKKKGEKYFKNVRQGKHREKMSE